MLLFLEERTIVEWYPVKDCEVYITLLVHRCEREGFGGSFLGQSW